MQSVKSGPGTTEILEVLEPLVAAPDYWDEACRHLVKKDRVMKRLIPQHGDTCLQ
ncbi:MAG: DNA-3-methyladenine glycosylase, partial [Polaromonas sp. 39-63-203]